MYSLHEPRNKIRTHILHSEDELIDALIHEMNLSDDERQHISDMAANLVRDIRTSSEPNMMESFLAQYGLSTKEGVALMCLAEAMLRVPDSETVDALIEDKIAPSDWGHHLGRSSSSLVNASTWALMLTGKMLNDAEEGLVGTLHGVVKRLGEPVIRIAISQAMRELARQFVLGRDIQEAVDNGKDFQEKGYTYSYDMLGEAACTDADARRYHLAYSEAITALAPHCKDSEIRNNPGISVKLSALHGRYEFSQRDRVMQELLPRAKSLALLAQSIGIGFNIDAEEADRLDLSLDLIETILRDEALAGWDGFGVVVQAYSRRAAPLIDWLYSLAKQLDRKIMVRLVKGAYWDSEIKQAQVLGLESFPVFTRKVATDVSYLACARKLFDMRDHIYPQFATHNAHTVAAILHMAPNHSLYEFQRLHGMGEALHEVVRTKYDVPCRIYAPVGAHRDLLAYLVRRLLENGANSSFVNMVVDENVRATEIAADPIARAIALKGTMANPAIMPPSDIYLPARTNSCGFDLNDPDNFHHINRMRDPFREHQWSFSPILGEEAKGIASQKITNPANPRDHVGTIIQAAPEDIETALTKAPEGFREWSALPTPKRAEILNRIADLYELHCGEFFALLTREAGKTLPDCIGELREAVDFVHYYANEAIRLAPIAPDNEVKIHRQPRGVIACISPWNFPLAIFSGQVLGALAAGNAVIAKPACQTVLIAARAIELMHEAGVPKSALQFLPGDGALVGGALTKDPRIDGVCFTGSTQTGKIIHRAMAEHLAADAPLIAETGGLNAMIVDSTALPEQAVHDIIASAFQSAGQRCSALRMLYVQEDIAETVLTMLYGAMDELSLGNPWELASDIGPIIDHAAKNNIDAYITKMGQRGLVEKQLNIPDTGYFVAPTVIRLSGIAELEKEIFGPVLHIATFESHQINDMIEAINNKGYGLTFGLHSRIDDRVQTIVERMHVGNIYVNRNQIGAIVASQPFGGEGLSGTGPKAGGPHYVQRMMRFSPYVQQQASSSVKIDRLTVERHALQAAIDGLSNAKWAARTDRQKILSSYLEGKGINPIAEQSLPSLIDCPVIIDCPGPTGESNRLSLVARGTVLCLGGDHPSTLYQQVYTALLAGNAVVACQSEHDAGLNMFKDQDLPIAFISGHPSIDDFTYITGIHAVAASQGSDSLTDIRRALAVRDEPLIPLITEIGCLIQYCLERHVCIDTTAAGGNASLLAANETT